MSSSTSNSNAPWAVCTTGWGRREMSSMASRAVDGDADSWCQEWITTAQRLATVAEGCNRHCEPMARSLLEQSMFDWLDETLPAATS